MTLRQKGLIVATVHVALVASLGAKLLVDRAAYPRVWVRAAPVDPNLPIRGRYVSLRLEAAVGPALTFPASPAPVAGPAGRTFLPFAPPVAVTLFVDHDTLVAGPGPASSVQARALVRDGATVAEILSPVAYFIPEGVPDPSRRAAGEELWVEVTVPRRGLPRPIRLGVKRDGVLTPLDLR